MATNRQRQRKEKKKKNAKSILHKHIKISNHYLLLGLSLRATAVASLRSFLSLASSAAIRTACSYIVVRRQQRIWCKRRNRYQLLLHMNNLYSSSWENDVKLENFLREYKMRRLYLYNHLQFYHID